MSRPALESHPRPTSENKREHAVLQYVAAYRDLPRLDEFASGPEACHLPADHSARHSKDSTLTALCQLAALRLNAQRALVSLIDGKYQHILAEATPRTSLRGGAPLADGSNSLWLGSVSIPRSWGVCEQVLKLADDTVLERVGNSVVVNRDLGDSDEYAQRTYVQHGPRVRFYAGAALISPQGLIVGALSVFDDAPRPLGLPDDSTTFLESLSATMIEYLGNYTVRDRFERGEKLTRGLISFAEGASALLPLDNHDHFGLEPHSPTKTPTTLGSDKESEDLPGAPIKPHTSFLAAETNDVASQLSQAGTPDFAQASTGRKKQHLSTASDTVRANSTQNTSLRALQNNILPINSKSMFARAANVMLASSDLDGVLILDASVAATGHRQHPAAPERERLGSGLSDSAGPNSVSASSDESSSQSSSAKKRSNSSSSKQCHILGAAPSEPLAHADGTPGLKSLAESDLSRLLQEYPHGKLFNYSVSGTSCSFTDDSSSNKDSNEALHSSASHPNAQQRRGRASKISKAVSELLPQARSVAFVPFWDYERSRWFAGCLCWTNSHDRLLSTSVDLAYFNIFSHSIMRELSRLDAVAMNHQKTTFVASISHELRSPLHGILGTLEFIGDTRLDAFQTSMLNSLNNCGQTLLDTINHVMDHSKMSELTKNLSTKRLKNTKTVRLSSKPLKTRRSLRDPAFNLGIATEEVVEAVFAGSSFLPIMSSKNAPLSPTESVATTSADLEDFDFTTKRKTCYIILDVAHEQDWTFCFPVGSWKRTVMNLFGNALKYTDRGHITVSLHATDVPRSTGSATTITLTITDTGTGMSPTFLANKAFLPFSQEDSHSSGVGLGLSIVRQIIETNGGKIEVSSDHSVGSKFTVKLSLLRPESEIPDPPQRTEYLRWLPRLRGRKVCILHRPEIDQDTVDEPQNTEGLAKFIQALTTTLTAHLKMNVVQNTKWEDNDTDLVICPEPSFEYLASIRDSRAGENAEKAAVTIFIALDALEAVTLRSDVRVKSKESVVEIVAQPLGPYKLAQVLNTCLDRLQSPTENSQRVSDSIYSPGTDISRSRSLSVEELPPPAPPSTVNKMSTLHDQLQWHATDEPEVTPVPQPHPQMIPMTAPGPKNAEQNTLSVRPKLTIPTNAANSSSHVLITDDNAINRRLLVAFVKKCNFRYAEAENGLEALRAYQSHEGQFNVILMDMSMPVMDGMSATRAIRQYEREYKIPRSCIIALTGLASASAKLEAWNAGIDHFMTKPVNFKALERRLKKGEARRDEASGKDRALASAPA